MPVTTTPATGAVQSPGAPGSPATAQVVTGATSGTAAAGAGVASAGEHPAISTSGTPSTTTTTGPVGETTPPPPTATEPTTTTTGPVGETTPPPPTATEPTTTIPSAPPGPPPPAYYLLESDGTIHAFGGAFSTKKTLKHRPAPIVGGAATPDANGYWMVAANGSVFNFGKAHFFGSAVHDHLDNVVGMAPTSDGHGYWLATSTGAVYAYGDAAFCGAASTRHLNGPVVGIVATPDGGGYWLYTQHGSIYNFGDARFFGSGVHLRTKVPVVSMATTADGKGYWVAYANGSIHNYGDARFFGSPVHRHLTAPIVSIAATPDGLGYYLTGATGRMANYGDAHFHGSFAHDPPIPPVAVVAVIATTKYHKPVVSPFSHGAIGYDISNFQCKKTGSSRAQRHLPPAASLEVLQVVGWLDSSTNSCLAAEAAWATQASAAAGGGAAYNLYIFMNSPGGDPAARALEATGPAGDCPNLVPPVRTSCNAYNYGYNGAANAIAYAASQGVQSNLWWLDVENGALAPGPTSNFAANQYWSGSKALNDRTIQGAIDAIRHAGFVAGIYSSSIQYPKIAGHYVPHGPKVPLWIAGVPWTNPPYTEHGLPGVALLAAWCAGTARYAGTKVKNDLFAGGVPWLLQETPGNIASPYGIDPDYAC